MLWLKRDQAVLSEEKATLVSRHKPDANGKDIEAERREMRIRRAARAKERSLAAKGGDLPSDEKKQQNADDLKVDAEISKVLNELMNVALTGNVAKVQEVARRLRELLARLSVSDRSRSSIARLVKRKIVQAYTQCGAAAIPELLDYVLDEDPMISQLANDQFTNALRDPSLGDRGRAEIVVSTATALTDDRVLDLLFTEIYNMRHSVAVEAMTQIFENGTPEAIRKIVNTMGIYTANQDIQTPEQLALWLEQNPDSSFDGLLYGPVNVNVKIETR